MIVDNFKEPENEKLKELYILMNTYRGTVPLHRDIGIDSRVIDKPITVVRNVIFSELQTQINNYIFGLRLINVFCITTDKGLNIQCEVEINNE